MDPGAILIVSSGVFMLLTLIGISYKTGFVSYSIWSLTRRDQPRFKVDKAKTGKFTGIVIAVFILNVVYGMLVFQDMHEIGGILILSLFNSIVISYGLAFWVLLREKKN